MNLKPLELKGAYLIEPDRIRDERGFFMRTFCAETFAAHGLTSQFPQCSLSFNERRGTLRGLHFQTAPHAETKIVRCTRGSVFDVIVDIREKSDTFGTWTAIELSAVNARAVYVPEGFAHGFQALEDSVEVSYQISTPYASTSAAGIRYDDQMLAIAWPIPVSVISNKDLNLPLMPELFPVMYRQLAPN